MGWDSGRPVSYPDVKFGKIGLYYVERPVRSSDAYPLANSLGAVIVGGDCIKMMIKKGTLVSDTPTGLLYAYTPATTGMLYFGGLRNGKFITTNYAAEGDAVGDGIFVYGPVPENIGIPIHYDPNAYYSDSCNVDLRYGT
uniref:Uncharacterized protein n=1 Tax=Marseillevirus LCMAC101 TaxID=2506602 RepID=A0A481YSA4_9VIRU|nr:MAG: hypothetical protein LCMAC101_07380 [Marseillevirus LCMAC101]